MNKKGQIAMIDFFAAVTIVIIFLAFLGVIWNVYTVRTVDRVEFTEMTHRAYQTADFLIRSSGRPVDWDGTRLEVIGLAGDDRNVLGSKYQILLENDELTAYDNIRSLLNIEGYEFYINITKLDREYFENGSSPPEKYIGYGMVPMGDNVINARRYIRFDNVPAIFDFFLWT